MALTLKCFPLEQRLAKSSIGSQIVREPGARQQTLQIIVEAPGLIHSWDVIQLSHGRHL